MISAETYNADYEKAIKFGYNKGVEDTVEKIKPILKGLEGSIYWYSRVCEQLEQLKRGNEEWRS